MSRRTGALLAAAVALLVLGRLLSTTTRPANQPDAREPVVRGSPASSSTAEASTPDGAAPSVPPLPHPASAVVTLGILTDRPEADLRALVDREAVIARVMPETCGDAEACEAVRVTLRDEHATSFQVVSASDWTVGRIDVDASGGRLSPGDRASIPRRGRVVMVSVATPTSPQQLALRAAFAATASIATRIGGLVHDPLLMRIETAHDFALHAVTAPLEASAFRRDRIELLYEPKEGGAVRIVTAGLSRWGAPDIEAARVPTVARRRVAEIVLAMAAALADGKEGPWTLSRDDIGRARGEDYPEEAELPKAAAIAVTLVPVRPETGDPNDFMARIEPPGGDGPIGYLELAERFFGRLLETSEPETTPGMQANVRSQLAWALARWDVSRASGAKVFVPVPFDIPGDAGTEWMWVEVTRHDVGSVTGKLVDEPLGATDFSRGDEITRPLGQVQAVRWGDAARGGR